MILIHRYFLFNISQQFSYNMKKNIRASFLATITILLTFIIFSACRKNFSDTSLVEKKETIIAESKAFYLKLLKSEKSLLDMPYDQLKKKANLRRFARIGKMADLLQWNKTQSYFQGNVNYALVPLEDDVHHLHNPTIESVRYMLFSERDGDKMQMKIIELYSVNNQSLGNDVPNVLRICAENMLFGKSKPIQELNASVIFYDQYYYNRASFQIINGNWENANIKVENTNKKVNSFSTSKQSFATNGRTNSNNLIKSGLSTVSPMSGCVTCETWYLLGIWSDNNTGAIIAVVILDSWDECTEPGYVPDGSAPGTTESTVPPPSNLNPKKMINELKDPCLSSTLETYGVVISEWVGISEFVNHTEPEFFHFSEDSTLPSGTNGGLNGSYYDINGILNYTIGINKDNLSTASIEYFTRTMLHEALHGALLTNGTAWDNIIQHNEIANLYRSSIATELQLLFPYLSQSEVDALSWEGLGGTSAWDALTDTQKTDIVDILDGFKKGGGSGHRC